MDSNEGIPGGYFTPLKADLRPPPPSPDERYGHGEYIIRRRMLVLLGSAIDVSTPYGMRVLFCHGKPFRLREDMRVYNDDQRSQELLVIKARQWLDFSAAYDVADSTTRQWVGTIKRCGWRSLVRDKWEIYDPAANLIGTMEEDSWGLALLRRFLTGLIPQSYNIYSASGMLVGEAIQFFNPFLYKLRLKLYEPPQRPTIDRRLLLAAGLLLATIEGRESS